MIIAGCPLTKEVAVIGSGAIGASTAWCLANHGHKVILIDPLLKKESNQLKPLNGSTASLGVLMGHVFRRSSGRGWRMRKRSMELWPKWIDMLQTKENPLTLNKPLVQLASSEAEAAFMARLISERKDLGLEILKPNTKSAINRWWPKNHYGGLISYQDGRINPLQLLQCLVSALDQFNVHKICEQVIKIERKSSTRKRQWQLYLQNDEVISTEIIIICAALGSETLLKPLGHKLPIKPVLGQVLDLEFKRDHSDWSNWPAVLCHEGVNMIPYRNNRMLIGATLEPGTNASEQALDQMKSMNGNAPDWLKQAAIVNHWTGLRGRPVKRPAPLLETLEPGLIVSTGHYRNGIVLAPASAEWVVEEVMKTEDQ